MGHMVHIYVILQENAELFSKEAISHFATCQIMCQCSNCSALLIFSVVIVLNLRCSNGCVVIFLVVLIHISLGLKIYVCVCILFK